MTDLSRLIADLCAGLDDSGDASFSGFSESVSGAENLQHTDKLSYFRSFQDFRSENANPDSDDASRSENIDFLTAAHARASSYVLEPERPERPESDSYPLAETPLSFFPVKDSELERPEREEPVAGVFPPPGDPLPISAADVRAGVARELRHLTDLGVTGPEAEQRAVEITAAKIGNSPALAERQPNTGQCHVCTEPLRDDAPAIAVMNPGGAALHMHTGCHGAHRARRTALVDRVMAAAGYGAEATGEAA